MLMNSTGSGTVFLKKISPGCRMNSLKRGKYWVRYIIYSAQGWKVKISAMKGWLTESSVKKLKQNHIPRVIKR